MFDYQRRAACGVLSLVLLFALGATALGQRHVTVPVGAIVPLRMDTALSSNSSRVGDRFTATVFRTVLVDGRAALSEGAKVEGHVTGLGTGERNRGQGSIAVAFDRIILANGSAIPIDATLTPLGEEARRRIEQDSRSQDSSGSRRALVFLGAGGGASATIGVARGGETNTVGAVLGTLLGNGERAEVQPGAEFGMIVERSFSIDGDTRGDTRIIGGDRVRDDRDNGAQSRDVLTSYEAIRSAQVALKSRNFYNGPINGVMNQTTRDAIQRFQRDRNIANSGELDMATARALGIPIEGGPVGSTGATGIGNPRQIALLANRLLQDFQRELNMRNNRGQVTFDTRRDFRPSEVEVLFQITSLQAAAELYNQLTAAVTDPDAVKGAAGGLMRQARLLDRIMRRDLHLTMSSIVSADWQQLQAELARISVADANQDGDIIR